ncbi:PKD domain-containing protein, partial [Candidatus Bathyarchaeota archaeon]|nr:PKD domain-containing protein [Candidatus Bathyarchaeota archaeon]
TWIFNDETLQELNGVTPQYVFHTPGVYTVELIVVDAANNLAFDTIKINVIDVTDPIANAGNDLVINQGETVTFDGSKSTDNVEITDFVWSLIDEITQKIEGVNAIHTFGFAGVYEIKLTVSDEQGNFGTDVILVTVIDDAWPVANAGLDQNVEEDTLVYFDCSASFDNVGIVSYFWTFTDGEVKSLYGVNSSYFFDTPGTYEVTLTVSDAEGHSANDAVMVVVRDITAPKIEFAEFNKIIEGVPTTFDASKSYDTSGIDNFYWIFGDGTLENSSAPSVTHVYTESGTYALKLFVTDKAGNVNSNVISVNVNPDPNTDLSSEKSDEQDDGQVLAYKDELNPESENPDTLDANINPDYKSLNELEEYGSKTNPEDNDSIDFSLGDILTIVIILLLTGYVLYAKQRARIDKMNEH